MTPKALHIDPIRHVVWKGDRLEVLDQRLLPRKVARVTCRDAAQVAAMSRAASRMAEERFSERLCIEPYLALFEELGGRRR